MYVEVRVSTYNTNHHLKREQMRETQRGIVAVVLPLKGLCGTADMSSCDSSAKNIYTDRKKTKQKKH